MSGEAFEGENLTESTNEMIKGSGDGERKMERRWIGIFVVCQKSAGIIHRNKKLRIPLVTYDYYTTILLYYYHYHRGIKVIQF